MLLQQDDVAKALLQRSDRSLELLPTAVEAVAFAEYQLDAVAGIILGLDEVEEGLDMHARIAQRHEDRQVCAARRWAIEHFGIERRSRFLQAELRTPRGQVFCSIEGTPQSVEQSRRRGLLQPCSGPVVDGQAFCARRRRSALGPAL